MLNKKAKIYIAGHRGMIGSSIIHKYQSEGYTNLLFKTRQELDLLDQKAVNIFFSEEKPEYVIVSAARVGGIKDNMTHQADFIYENTQIQNNIIWSAHQHNVKKLLFLGSSCIYPRNCPQPMKETYFMEGKVESTNEGYAIAKIVGMKLCEKIYEQYGQCFISCMPTNAYGPNDNFTDDNAHVIPSLIRRIHQAKVKNDQKVIIWGSGNSRREFLYVDDLADAIFFLMNAYNNKEFINVGTGEDISIRDLAFLIKDIVGYKGKLVFDTRKPDGMPKKLLDVSKITNIGWRYKTSFQQGLKKTYIHFMNLPR